MSHPGHVKSYSQIIMENISRFCKLPIFIVRAFPVKMPGGGGGGGGGG